MRPTASRTTGAHHPGWGDAPFLAARMGEVISGTEDDDTIEGGRGDDIVFGNGGDDDLDGGAGDDVMEGGAGRDFLLGGSGADVLSGGAGEDRLAGASGDDIAYGGAGGDTLDGDAGADQLYGGDGADVIFGQSGDDQEFGGAGRDELYGDAGNDTLDGGEGNDELEGDAGADTLTGGAGADVFKFFTGRFNPSSPFAGHDLITDFSSAERDTLDLNGARAAFVGLAEFEAVEGAQLGYADDGIAQLFYTHVGERTVLVLDENDNGVLDARDFTLEFEGQVALGIGDFVGTEFFAFGTPEGDQLGGSRGDDRLAGLDGDDVLKGLAGNDVLLGGNGNDRVLAGGGFDDIRGDDGDDLLVIGSYGSAYGGDGDDRIRGSDVESAFNVLEGEAGNDRILAGDGAAQMNGGESDDILKGGIGNDLFVGGAGVDRFVFAANWGADFIQDLEDGIERIDLRATGLTFDDLTITTGFGGTLISSSQGTITLALPIDQVSAVDFIFA